MQRGLFRYDVTACETKVRVLDELMKQDLLRNVIF